MHMGVRCFKIEQQEDYKQVNIGPNCLKGWKHSSTLYKINLYSVDNTVSSLYWSIVG